MVDRFRGFLTQRKVKREELATIWDVNIMTVSNKLNGKTKITCDELMTAAKHFNISDAELLYILLGESRLIDPLN